MTTKINTGLLAFGMSGRLFHAPFIAAHPGFHLRAVTERHQKSAAETYPGIISYDNVEALIADKEIDLVIINTPNFTHYEYARQALLAGKHIIVEKPFTATSAQAEELFALGKQLGKKIMVYQNRRYDSGFNAVRHIVESSRLGELVEVHFRFDRYRNQIGPKYFKEEPYPASGISYDLGSHLVDQAVCLFGKPLRFHTTLAKHRANTLVDDYFSVHLEYPGQLNVFLTASMLVADIGDAFVLHGSQGSFRKNHADVQENQLQGGMNPDDPGYGIEDPNDAGRLTIISPAGERTTSSLASKKGNYMLFFEAVYQHLINNSPFSISEEEILTQLHILEADTSKKEH